MKLSDLMEVATQSRLRLALREHARAARRLDKALGDAVAHGVPRPKKRKPRR